MYLTLKEVRENYDWLKVCDILELSPYCLNEGIDPDIKIEITMNQAMELGLPVCRINKKILIEAYNFAHKKIFGWEEKDEGLVKRFADEMLINLMS